VNALATELLSDNFLTGRHRKTCKIDGSTGGVCVNLLLSNIIFVNLDKYLHIDLILTAWIKA